MKATGPRWKLLTILLAIPLLGVLGFRLSPLDESGWGGAITILAVMLAMVFTLIWLLLLSGMPWKHRFRGLLVLVLMGASLGGSIRMEGHMGDFIPQFGWRCAKAVGDVGELDLTGAPAPVSEVITPSPADFPFFLGPNRDNWVSGGLLAADWAQQKPKELWRREIGLGWASFAVVGPYAYTLEQRDAEELVVCYEVRTGKPVWAHRESVRFEESMGGIGPRTTPSVANGKVYSLGATGVLVCLDALTGAVHWRKETLKEFGHENLMWAKSSSPFVVDDLVVVTLGDSDKPSIAAYDTASGELRWQAGDDRSSYATPAVMDLAGKRQLVVVNSSSVTGHDPATGEQLWKHEIGKAPAHNTVPLNAGENRLLVSVGYGRGAWLIEVKKDSDQPSGFKAEEVWHSTKMKTKFADMVIRDGYAYGLDEARLVCLDLKTGQRAWRGKKYGHGQLLGVGNKLLIQSETGDIVIAEASPDGHEVINRFDALTSKTWNHPTLAGRILLVRNDREVVAFEYEGNGSSSE